jgi:glycosyltransferase involved in cell wall biosynthesis
MIPHSKAPKKILLLSGFRIFPSNTGGHVHTGGIASALARMGHSVLVYSLAGRQGDYRLAEVFGPSYRVDLIENNLREETHLGLFYGLLQASARRLDVPRAWQYGLMHVGLVPRRLKAALRDADIILSDMPWCPRIPGPWSGKPWFLVSHNLEYRLLQQASPRQRRFADWMCKVESSAPQLYRDIFPCAETDRDFFRDHGPARDLKLPIIRCGVDPLAYQVPVGTRERIRAELEVEADEYLLVFSGSRFAPNLEALDTLRQFCRTEADYLKSRRIRFLVLGSMSDAHREGALIATGRVDSVTPYFAAADAGLNPIVRGSGANVKLFEYLATRLPVISTAFGVRGTDLQPWIDYLEYEPSGLRQALDAFVDDRTPAEWRAFAEAVWSRHHASCDIQDLVHAAVAQRPEFS